MSPSALLQYAQTKGRIRFRTSLCLCTEGRSELAVSSRMEPVHVALTVSTIHIRDLRGRPQSRHVCQSIVSMPDGDFVTIRR